MQCRTINQLSLRANKVSLKVNISGWHPFSLSICSRLKFHPASETWSAYQIPNLGVVQIYSANNFRLVQIYSAVFSSVFSICINSNSKNCWLNQICIIKKKFCKISCETWRADPEGDVYAPPYPPILRAPSSILGYTKTYHRKTYRSCSFLSPAFIPWFLFCI